MITMKRKGRFTPQEITLCGLWSALVALGSFIKVPLPVVPFTLQFLFANLAGLLLGSRMAAVVVGTYIALGLMGLPIFYGGYGGISYILNPNFGFVVGILLGAYFCGMIANTSTPPCYGKYLFAGLCNMGIIYFLGFVYYGSISNYYLQMSMNMGYLTLYLVLLVMPGDVLLCFASAAIAQRVIPILTSRWNVLGHRQTVPARFDMITDP